MRSKLQATEDEQQALPNRSPLQSDSVRNCALKFDAAATDVVMIATPAIDVVMLRNQDHDS